MRSHRLTALLAAGLLTITSVTSQELITNGDFETGDFSGWMLNSTGGTGDWVINDGSSVIGAAGILAPTAGAFDATSDQLGPGTRMASNCFVVPSGVASARVRWTDTIRNFAGSFADPNQEFRVYFADAMGSQVGPTLFSTDPGDALMQPATDRALDVTAFLQGQVGNTLCLVFDEEDNFGNFHVSIDDVSLVALYDLAFNGDLETGDLTGWAIDSTGGFGDWIVNDGTFVFDGSGTPFAPIGGAFDLSSSAIGPGLRRARNTFLVPAGITTATVQWTDEIRDFNGALMDPNQEFRVYLADATGAQVGPELFSTDAGDPSIQPPTTRSVDVTALLQSQAGNLLSLTFEEEGRMFFFHVSIDDVAVLVDQPAGPPPALAFTTEFGVGCPDGGSIYEFFPPGMSDLSGLGFTFAPSATGYVVTQGAGPITSVMNPVAFSDDSVGGPFPLGFTFDYPGGSTTAVEVSSNGYVYLQVGTIPGSRCCFGDPTLFSGDEASVAVFGADLNPGAGGQVFIDSFVDRFVVTWLGVPNFGGASSVDAQVQLFDDGRITLSYGGAVNTNAAIVGVSTGMVADPGSRDLSSINGQTLVTFGPLELSGGGSNPVLGTTYTWNIDEIPTGAIAGAVLLGFSQLNVDLTGIGAPGCFVYSSGDSSISFAGGPASVSVSLPIPGLPSLAGLALETQAVVLALGFNPLGVITSNGLTLTLGDF